MPSEGYPVSHTFGEDDEKLTDFSRKRAARKMWWVWFLRRFSIMMALAGTVPAIFWIARNVHSLLSLHTKGFHKPASAHSILLVMHWIAQVVLNLSGGTQAWGW